MADDEEKGSLAASPEIQQRRLEHRLSTDRFERETSWRSCCFTVDRRACVYIIKTLFSGATLAFCMIQIARDGDGCSNQLISWYTATIGTLVGGFMARERFSDHRGDEENVNGEVKK
jgi:hypothetical protein